MARAAGMDALERRERWGRFARVAAPAAIVLLLAVLVWRLASNTAGERREAPQVPVVALTPPPPPPPPPKEPPPEPQPQKTVETPQPTPTPQPKTNAPDKATPGPKALTINGPPQAGTDAFGVSAGKGGGVMVGGDPNGSDTPGGGGGDLAAASYGGYLKSALQQAVQSDERVGRMVFAAAEVSVWVDPSGRVTRVAIVKSSGDRKADDALLAALRQIGRLDEAPPPNLPFPAHVTLSGRRA